VAGRADQPLRERRAGDLPGQRVFAPARPDDEDVHGRMFWGRMVMAGALARAGCAGQAAPPRNWLRLAGLRRGSRQVDREGGALAGRALHGQAAAMAVDDVLDDGETQARAGPFARALALHPVETLGEARQVLAFDAPPRVGDAQR